MEIKKKILVQVDDIVILSFFVVYQYYQVKVFSDF